MRLTDQADVSEGQPPHQGALMHVLAATAEALFVVLGKGRASSAATLAHIAAVDPPSAAVRLTEVGEWKRIYPPAVQHRVYGFRAPIQACPRPIVAAALHSTPFSGFDACASMLFVS